MKSYEVGYAGYVRWGTRVWCFRTRALANEGFRFVRTPWKAAR
jgi:hypothetical protein